MIDTVPFQELQAMVRRRFHGSGLNRYLAVLSETEAIFEGLDPMSVDIDAVKANYKDGLNRSELARKTHYNRIYRLKSILDAALKEGIIASAKRVSDFPEMEKPGDEVGKRLYKNFVRFRDYCLNRNVSFYGIDEVVIKEYLSYLKDAFARGTAEVAYNDLARWWQLAGFPRLKFEPFTGSGKNHYGLHVKNWPSSWNGPMNAFRAAAERGVANPMYGTWRKALGPVAAKEYEKVVGYFAGYLNQTGAVLHDESLKDVLAKPARVIEFIEWHIRYRCGGAERCYHASWLGMLARLDRFFSKRDKVQSKYMDAWEGLQIELVRETIDTDALSLHLLFNAAEDAAEEAILNWNNSNKNISSAIRFRSLLMLSLLVYRPLRASNLTGLQFGTGVFNSESGSENGWQIRVKAADFKGRRVWEGAWPQPLVEALVLYKEEVHQVIAGPDNPIVFPSKSGRRLSDPDLYDIIVGISEEKLGRRFSPHQFRALIGTLYLLEYPNEVWTIQHLLGHRFLTTTLRHYIHVTARQASRRAGAFVHDHCEAARQVGHWQAGDELVAILQ